jgi:flagellar biogenesis protein FliO
MRRSARLCILVGLAAVVLGRVSPLRAQDADSAAPVPSTERDATAADDTGPSLLGPDVFGSGGSARGDGTGADGPSYSQSGVRPADPPTTGSDLGAMLLEMLLVLAAVCLLAYVALRWGLERIAGLGATEDGPIELVARRQLGADRAISVVRIGSQTLIVGESDAGITRLGELDDDSEM